jgi:hypothetical protein
MERDRIVFAYAWPVPPVHGVEMDVGMNGQPPAYLVVADLPSPAVIGEDRIADESYDRALALFRNLAQ